MLRGLELSWAEVKFEHMAVEMMLYVSTTDALYLAQSKSGQAKSAICVVNLENGLMHQIDTTDFK